MTRRSKIAAGVCVAAIVGLCAWVWFVPFPYDLLRYDNLTSTRIVDRHGRPLREALGSTDGRARQVGLQAISAQMVAATVHAEDRRFWEHAGVDPIAIARASWQNLTHGEVVSGASTITQQVVKMVLGGSRSRTIPNKLEEAVWAIRLDKLVRKRTILAQYLNRAPYGNQLFGVSAAARMYFDKPPAQLTLAESALLAGIPRAPSLNNPYADFERAKRIQRRILALMHQRGAIDDEDYRRAIDEELVIHSRRGRVVAAHFTDYVLANLGETRRPQQVDTTLDLDLQRKVRGVVRTELSQLEAKNVGQAAAVVLDTRTGEVLAWVGSRDYFDDAHDGANDGVLARRQPGSALKAFVYGLYLEDGGTAADMLPDFPQQFPAKDGVYIPKNYDQHYHGPISVREALASSLNIPAVVVAERVGVEKIRDKLLELGFGTLEESADYYGLGIALGNGEVRLLDLAGAYATLGRLGEVKPVRTTLDTRAGSPGSDGGPASTATRAFTRQTAYTLLDILSDDAARARGFGRFSPLYLPYKVAAKTGTSAGYRDNWAVGVTPDYTVAVWAGNFDAEPMNGSSGITGAAPIMRQIVQTLYPKAANAADVPWYEPPAGVEPHEVCTLSGHKPGPHCPTTRLELFAEGSIPDKPCDIHRALRIDTRNGLLAGPDCPPSFVAEREFADVPDAWTEWAIERGEELPPTRYSPLCPGADAAASTHAQRARRAQTTLRVAQPRDGDTFFIDPTVPADQQQVALRADVPAGLRGQQLTWFVDGEPLGAARASAPTFWTLTEGTHAIGVGRERVEARVDIHVR